MIDVEIRAAEGGEDSRLLIDVLASCYKRRALNFGWKVEERERRDGQLVLRVNAPLDKWKREAGGHRFQRVPPTERRGRVHTSTVTVAVFPAEKQATVFDPADVRLEWFSGTGKGGQHRNKHQNSCRAFHEPTGLSAKAECRSRENSQAEAMAELERRVRALLGGELGREEASERRAQVGTGMRGDKIRTYRLQDDTVTDHRTDQRVTWRQAQRGELPGD